jgi:hypothetical protein
MKAYKGRKEEDPFIINLGTRQELVVKFTSRPFYLQGKTARYPLNRRLGEPQLRSGLLEERTSSCLCPESITG